MALPLDSLCPNQIKIIFNGDVSYVTLVEDLNPISSNWIEDFLDLRSSFSKPQSNLNPWLDLEGSISDSGKNDREVPLVSNALIAGVLGNEEAIYHGVREEFHYSKMIGQQSSIFKNVGNLTTSNLIPSADNRKVEKGKGSWVKKTKVKANASYDRTTGINLEKRLNEVGGSGFSKSLTSTSFESDCHVWKGECSRRYFSSGSQSPSLAQVQTAHIIFPSKENKIICDKHSKEFRPNKVVQMSKDFGSHPNSPLTFFGPSGEDSPLGNEVSESGDVGTEEDGECRN